MEVVRSEIENFARKKDDDDDRFGARAMLRRKFRVQKQMIDDEHTIEHRFFNSLSFKIFPSFKLLRHLSKSRLAILYKFFFCDLLLFALGLGTWDSSRLSTCLSRSRRIGRDRERCCIREVMVVAEREERRERQTTEEIQLQNNKL